MVFPRTLRGDVAQILNPMVREGQITAFRTNFYDRAEDEDIVVIVTASGPDALDLTRQQVSQALSALPVPIVVRVDLP